MPCSSSPQARNKLCRKSKPAMSSSCDSLAMGEKLMVLAASFTFSSSPLWWCWLSVSLFQRLTTELTLARYSATGRGLPCGSSSVNTDSSSTRLPRAPLAAGGPFRELGSPLNLFGGCKPSSRAHSQPCSRTRALNAVTVLSSGSSTCLTTSHHTSRRNLTSDGAVSWPTYRIRCRSSARKFCSDENQGQPSSSSSYADTFFIFRAANHVSLSSAAMACTKENISMFG
uniref:Uncharacterized protein n=1 Tax=Pavo cristatus TaxID=9049 RepID=A0A8C9G550_PAVCR